MERPKQDAAILTTGWSDETMKSVGATLDAGEFNLGLCRSIYAALHCARERLVITEARRDERQRTVADWCQRAFGVEHATSLPQRGVRLAEEAIELAQAAGSPREMLHRMVDYIYDREPGELQQEVGGVSVTLLALCAAAGISADQAEATEVRRVLAKPVEHFTARNEAKNAAGFNTVTPQ